MPLDGFFFAPNINSGRGGKCARMASTLATVYLVSSVHRKLYFPSPDRASFSVHFFVGHRCGHLLYCGRVLIFVII
jgi:hypothetical protein